MRTTIITIIVTFVVVATLTAAIRHGQHVSDLERQVAILEREVDMRQRMLEDTHRLYQAMERYGVTMHNALIDQLIRHEGERLKPYRCTSGKLTIGVGRNLEGKGISKAESRMLLTHDIMECTRDLMQIFPQWEVFSESRKTALTDMRFNLGPSGFRSFRRMIAAIHLANWDQAAREALDSRWATQVQPSRVETVTRQLRDG